MERRTQEIITAVLARYRITANIDVAPLASGLINNTWKVSAGDQQFILQRVNHNVFRSPADLAENMQMVAEYVAVHSPEYLFVSPITASEGELIVEIEAGYFRLFPFVTGSHTINVVSNDEQAYEAAQQFGKFTRLLSGFDASRLHITIPDFHNLDLRYQQFEDAIANGNKDRIAQSQTLISNIRDNRHILEGYYRIRESNQVRQRVTHHDTKISNVLFDHANKGMCVIDLDTVMPGYFISDMGDMFRTYLSPANEEERDFSRIDVREDIFAAIVRGYLSFMGDELTEEEKGLMLYAGQFLVYMQAIRFLADYCNNDVYYGARYEEHNFVRAGNQLELLRQLNAKADLLQSIIDRELKSGNYQFRG